MNKRTTGCIVTIRPWDINIIDEIIKKQFTIVRINVKTCSRHEDYLKIYNFCDKLIKVRPFVKFIFDVPYPSNTFRINVNLKNFVKNISNNEVIIIYDDSSDAKKELTCQLKLLNVEEGDLLYYADGENIFLVEEVTSTYIKLRSKRNGSIIDGKPIHTQRNKLKSQFFDDVEINKLVNNYKENLFAIALSFAHSNYDVLEAKKQFGCKIISKIEDVVPKQGIKRIINASDYVMIGRGDLLFTADFYRFFNYYTYLLKRISKKKKLIVATDILSSMNDSDLPSRGDLIDINFILKFCPRYIVLEHDLLMSKRYNVVKKIAEGSFSLWEKENFTI